MKIKATVLADGYINCFSGHCPFRSECANHCSAGKFRIEDGCTPDLFEENDIFYCRTQTLAADQHHMGFPSHVSGLGAMLFIANEFRHISDRSKS